MKRNQIIDRSDLWQKEGSYKRVDPYSHFFVYTMSGKCYLFKGGLVDLTDEVDLRIDEPYVSYQTYFHSGKTRGSPSFKKLPDGVKAYFMRNSLIICKDGETILEKPLKRYPRKFPYQLKKLLDG